MTGRRGLSWLNDPAAVREQYATEHGLAARSSLYEQTTGPHPADVAFTAIAERAPRRVLEVGCGTGWFSARLQRELRAAVVAIDQSRRMVELARGEGVDARVADVQQLPFADGEFECVAALWMLYHVPDLDRGLAEIARVLRPGGTLVAVTNGIDSLIEIWELVGATDERLAREQPFASENGAEILGRHFAEVETQDAGGTVTIADRDAIVRYLSSAATWQPYAARLPEDVDLPLVARRSSVVFVATK